MTNAKYMADWRRKLRLIRRAKDEAHADLRRRDALVYLNDEGHVEAVYDEATGKAMPLQGGVALQPLQLVNTFEEVMPGKTYRLAYAPKIEALLLHGEDGRPARIPLGRRTWRGLAPHDHRELVPIREDEEI